MEGEKKAASGSQDAINFAKRRASIHVRHRYMSDDNLEARRGEGQVQSVRGGQVQRAYPIRVKFGNTVQTFQGLAGVVHANPEGIPIHRGFRQKPAGATAEIENFRSFLYANFKGSHEVRREALRFILVRINQNGCQGKPSPLRIEVESTKTLTPYSL